MTMFIRRTTMAASVAMSLALLVASAQQSATAAEAAKPAATKSAKSDIAIPDIPYTKFVLENGLTLLVLSLIHI